MIDDTQHTTLLKLLFDLAPVFRIIGITIAVFFLVFLYVHYVKTGHKLDLIFLWIAIILSVLELINLFLT